MCIMGVCLVLVYMWYMCVEYFTMYFYIKIISKQYNIEY